MAKSVTIGTECDEVTWFISPIFGNMDNVFMIGCFC